MKTLYGTVGFVVLAVIAIVAVLTIRVFAFATPRPALADQKFTLKIGRTPDDYADVKSQADFDKALKALRDHGGRDEINFQPNHGPVIHHYHPHHRAGIKTDKVTTSEAAKNAPAGESAANDPNVTYRVTANNPTDVQNVLDTLK
jgi:hypothetical protein